jgi:caprin-1
MCQESVREDFLAGRNGAALLGEEELKYLDDLYSEVSPKHGGEDGAPPFQVCLHVLTHLLLSVHPVL